MTLVVVRGRQEIYDRLRSRQSSPPRPQPRISVRAPELDEQVRGDLQSDIQAVLERTLRRVQSAQSRAGREPPSDDEIGEMIRAQFSSAQRPPAPEQERPKSNGGIRVATSGLNLPPEDRRAFQSEVRQLVQERLAGMSQAQSRPQVTVCGCYVGGCCWPPAGGLGDLTTIANLLPPTANTSPVRIALSFPSEGIIHGDAIMFQIWKTPLDLPSTSIGVGLRIDPAQDPDQWAKEITGWKICKCNVQTDHVESASHDYCWMTITKDQVDTLAFRKAVFLGWHNSGYLGPKPDVFWKLLGGLVITFDWISDDGGIST
jgi:hypothetical protein